MSTPGGGIVIRDGKMAWSGMLNPPERGELWSYAWKINPKLKILQEDFLKMG